MRCALVNIIGKNDGFLRMLSENCNGTGGTCSKERRDWGAGILKGRRGIYTQDVDVVSRERTTPKGQLSPVTPVFTFNYCSLSSKCLTESSSLYIHMSAVLTDGMRDLPKCMSMLGWRFNALYAGSPPFFWTSSAWAMKPYISTSRVVNKKRQNIQSTTRMVGSLQSLITITMTSSSGENLVLWARPRETTNQMLDNAKGIECRLVVPRREVW